jgi:hypothetical protein
MPKHAAAMLLILCAPNLAHAGGGVGYSAIDETGTIERVVETRALEGGLRGVMVSYARKDGTQSMVEYGFRCDPLAFAYLGMNNRAGKRRPNLRLIREESDRLLKNGIEVSAVAGDPIGKLAKAVCS